MTSPKVIPGYDPARAIVTRSNRAGRLDCGHQVKIGDRMGFDPRGKATACCACHYDMEHEPTTSQAFKGGGY